MATWGSGKPVIALGSDIDCIPQASQKPGVAYHEPIIDGAPGHGEGHNSGMPLQIAAALAVKKIMEQQHLSGHAAAVARRRRGTASARRRTTSAPARSRTSTSRSSRTSAPTCSVGWGDSASNGLVSVEYTFKGESAHAAGAPWRGRSALDAVELMDIGWNFRREHLRLQQRSHYVITNGGDQPNVVPPNASVWYYFRETDYDAHQGDVGHRRQDGQGGGDDDRHRGRDARARIGLAGALQQDGRRDDAREHRDGRACRSGPTPTRRWPRRCSAS